ncbi:MAG: hypothetical protein ACRD2Z_09420 [Thermoanaerobaculia bacterium]
MTTAVNRAVSPVGAFLATPATSGYVLGYTAAPGRVVLAVAAFLAVALLAYGLALMVGRYRRPRPRHAATVRQLPPPIDPYAELRRQVAAACASIDRIGEHVAAGVAAELEAVNEARQAVASVTALTTELDELRTALTPRDRKAATR